MDPNAVPPVTQPVTSPTPAVLVPPVRRTSPWLWLLPAIIFAALAGYLFYQNRALTRQLATPPPPSPTSSADPTSDWQTYTNSIYGVSFRYPSNYTISKCGGESTIVEGEDNGVDGKEKDCVYIYDLNEIPSEMGIEDISLDFSLKPTNQDFATYLNVDSKRLTVIGEKLAHIAIAEVGPHNSYRNKQVNIEISSSVVALVVGPYDSSETEQVFDQILSTFQFTNTQSYSLDEISQACIAIRNSSKYWSDKYQECVSPDGAITLEDFCAQYGGTFVKDGDSCRHAREEGIPCGPTLASYCSFTN